MSSCHEQNNSKDPKRSSLPDNDENDISQYRQNDNLAQSNNMRRGSITIEDVMMCENHADILERGVDDSSAPATPYEGPRQPSAMIYPPILDLSNFKSENIQSIEEIDGTCAGNNPDNMYIQEASSSSRIELHLSQKHDLDDPESNSTDERAETQMISDKITSELLAIDHFHQSQNGHISNHGREGTILLVPLENNDLVTQSSIEQSSSVHEMTRSKSYSRLLQEAAQFAEAIGEPRDGIIPVIIDDDDDDSDDDEEDENNQEQDVSLHESDGNDISVSHSLHSKDPTYLDEGESSYTHMKKELDLSKDASLPPLDGIITTPFNESNLPDEVDLSSLHVDKVGAEISQQNFMKDETNIILHEENDNDNDNDNDSDDDNDLLPNTTSTEVLKEILPPAAEGFTRKTSNYIFRHKLPLSGDDDASENVEIAYRGIKPPEVTKRGISRGNYAQLHRKAWLEVIDKDHRYGKNLRTYYKYWEKMGHPTNMFFDWLDSKGETDGKELPNLPECPREVLDSDRVLYTIDSEQQQSRYLLKIVPCVPLSQTSSSLVFPASPSVWKNEYCADKPSMTDNGNKHWNSFKLIDRNGKPVITGMNGWIFVLRDHELYGAEKKTSISGASKHRFHHSSFFGGKAVAAAGIIITDANGCLTRLYPHSGHYRPGEAHMQRMLYHLHHCGVDLCSFLVDMQQIMHVSREIRDERTPKGGNCDIGANGPKVPKAKKTDSLHLKDGKYVALFLAHKARSIMKGLFRMIHKIRRVDPYCVRNILKSIDNGGVGKKSPFCP